MSTDEQIHDQFLSEKGDGCNMTQTLMLRAEVSSKMNRRRINTLGSRQNSYFQHINQILSIILSTSFIASNLHLHFLEEHSERFYLPCNFPSSNMPNLESFVDFDPEKDIPSLVGRVIFVTGGMFYGSQIQIMDCHGDKLQVLLDWGRPQCWPWRNTIPHIYTSAGGMLRLRSLLWMRCEASVPLSA
jgi:predicted membrane channel-forming protein YqfA (hemolysin III family)